MLFKKKKIKLTRSLILANQIIVKSEQAKKDSENLLYNIALKKSDSSELFDITFFDPIFYLLINKNSSVGKKFTHSYFVSSLFPNLKFYRTSNLKIEIINLGAQKTNFVCKNFNPFDLKPRQSSVLFFINVSFKNKTKPVLFSALINRKIKEKRILIKPLIYFLCSSDICSVLYKPYFCSLYSKNQKDFNFNQRTRSIKQHLLPLLKKSLQKQGQQKYLGNSKAQLVIYRPLIGINREVISFFDQQLNLIIIYDKSNNNLNLTRNFIRHKILPLLRLINPQVEQNLYKFSQIAAFYLDQTGDIYFDSKQLDIFKP